MATTTPPTPLPTAPSPTAQLEGAAPSVPHSPPTPGPVAPMGDSSVAPVSPAPVQARHQREDTPFPSQPVQQREPTAFHPSEGAFIHQTSRHSHCCSNSFTIHHSAPFFPPTLTSPTSYNGPNQHHLHCPCPCHQ